MPQPLFVAIDPDRCAGRIQRDGNRAFLCHHLEILDGRGHQPGQVQPFPFNLPVRGAGDFGAGEEQQVVDIGAQLHGHLGNALQRVLIFFGIPIIGAQGHFGLAAKTQDGGAQFVADVGQKLPPRGVHAQQFAVQPVQFHGALGHPLLKGGLPLFQSGLLAFQFAGHVVEVGGEVAELVLLG